VGGWILGEIFLLMRRAPQFVAVLGVQCCFLAEKILIKGQKKTPHNQNIEIFALMLPLLTCQRWTVLCLSPATPRSAQVPVSDCLKCCQLVCLPISVLPHGKTAKEMSLAD